MSSILEDVGRESLKENITIVPAGGLEKVGTFISLLRGNELNIACLLDTFNDPKGKAKLDKMVKENIIRKKQIRFYDEFLDDCQHADIEDLFTKDMTI